MILLENVDSGDGCRLLPRVVARSPSARAQVPGSVPRPLSATACTIVLSMSFELMLLPLNWDETTTSYAFLAYQRLNCLSLRTNVSAHTCSSRVYFAGALAGVESRSSRL